MQSLLLFSYPLFPFIISNRSEIWPAESAGRPGRPPPAGRVEAAGQQLLLAAPAAGGGAAAHPERAGAVAAQEPQQLRAQETSGHRQVQTAADLAAMHQI